MTKKIELPKPKKGGGGGGGEIDIDKYTSLIPDPIATMNETIIGYEGMRVDRELFKKFEDRIVMDDIYKEACGTWKLGTSGYTHPTRNL